MGIVCEKKTEYTVSLLCLISSALSWGNKQAVNSIKEFHLHLKLNLLGKRNYLATSRGTTGSSGFPTELQVHVMCNASLRVISLGVFNKSNCKECHFSVFNVYRFHSSFVPLLWLLKWSYNRISVFIWPEKQAEAWTMSVLGKYDCCMYDNVFHFTSGHLSSEVCVCVLGLRAYGLPYVHQEKETKQPSQLVNRLMLDAWLVRFCRAC